MNNGGCDSNAICSRDTRTNVIKCTCKTGYTNVGANSTVVCRGINNQRKMTSVCKMITTAFIYFFQTVVKLTTVDVTPALIARVTQQLTQLNVFAELVLLIQALIRRLYAQVTNYRLIN